MADALNFIFFRHLLGETCKRTLTYDGFWKMIFTKRTVCVQTIFIVITSSLMEYCSAILFVLSSILFIFVNCVGWTHTFLYFFFVFFSWNLAWSLRTSWFCFTHSKTILWRQRRRIPFKYRFLLDFFFAFCFLSGTIILNLLYCYYKYYVQLLCDSERMCSCRTRETHIDSVPRRKHYFFSRASYQL